MMFFSRKIYYNNKPLILTNDREKYSDDHPLSEGYLSLTGAFPRNYRLAMEHLDKPRTLGAVIEDISAASLEKELHAIYTPVDAAGGVVFSEDKNVLMIYRRGKWDLPKGKRDDGEPIEDCALREVSEETGLHSLTLGRKICDTYHVYAQGGLTLLKRTYWYEMAGTKQEQLVPQKEENILEARWIPEKQLSTIIFKSYEAIRDVMKQAGLRW